MLVTYMPTLTVSGFLSWEKDVMLWNIIAEKIKEKARIGFSIFQCLRNRKIEKQI